MLLLAIIAFYSNALGQESPLLDELREKFQAIDSEEDIEQIIGLSIDPNDPDAPTARAYQATSTCMMADYVFSPIKKLKYFNKGKADLEELIAEQKTVEKVYLRLLLQLNIPKFLNYHKNIDEDLAYLEAELPGAKIDVEYKDIMIQNLVTLANENEVKETLLGIEKTGTEKKL
jgi:hypothetical protein